MTNAPSPEDTVAALRALGLVPGAKPLPSTDTLSLVPRDESLQKKDIPLDQLHQKLTSMRDKLRVMEQRINASEVSAEARAQLQQTITTTAIAINGLSAFLTEESMPLV
jgi:hypothetical protein